MKKRICFVLCLLLALPIAVTAYAENEDIMLCYTYVDSIRASLKISSGSAAASGSVIPSGSLETSVTVRLQRESSSGTWVTISTWTGSNEGGKSEAGGTKKLTSGYNYRVCVTGKVYDSAGTVLETVNKYSATKSY